MSTDLRAAILARCDELQQLARDAADMVGGLPRWLPMLASQDAGLSVAIRPVRGVLPPIASPNRLILDQAVATFEVPAAGYLLGAFDPAAVLALVAGAREICEAHDPVLPVHPANFPICSTCGNVSWDYSENWPCPTVVSLARMLGVSGA